VPLILVETDRELPRDRLQASQLVRASGAPDGDHVVLPIEPMDGRLATLAHELTHQFAFEMIPLSSPVPAWVHEGLADHESGAWAPSDALRVREAAASNALPAVTSLGASDRLWGHAVFDFVAAEYGTQGIRRYLAALGNSQPAADSSLAAFGIAASDFDRAFQMYVRNRFADR
jgi:hypothetical protein